MVARSVNRRACLWRLLTLGYMPILHGGANAAINESALLLRDGGFESDDSLGSVWHPFQHAGDKAYEVVLDASEKKEGKRSLRISRVRPQVFCGVRQVVEHPVEGSYRLSAWLRSRGTGVGGWSLTAHVVGSAGASLDFATEALAGDVEWVERSVVFDVPAAAKVIEVIVSLVGGGTGWIDQVTLRRTV